MLSGRFEIQDGYVTVLHDPAGQLAKYLATGRITAIKRRYLASLLSASYKQVIWELEGLTYLPRYGVAVEPRQGPADVPAPEVPVQ